jgi:hypothetical protein
MRIRFALAIGGCLVALMTVCGSARAADGAWFLTLESGMGRGNLTYEIPGHPVTLDSKTVLRHSLAVGRSYGDHVVGSVAVSWVERGATDRVLTVFRPEGGRTLSFERTYLDFGVPVSYRLRRASAYVGFGLSPRLSFLVGTKRSPVEAKYNKGPLVGLDPDITVGYRAVHVTARYLVDLVSAHDTSSSSSKVRIADKVFFIGLGYDIAL